MVVLLSFKFNEDLRSYLLLFRLWIDTMYIHIIYILSVLILLNAIKFINNILSTILSTSISICFVFVYMFCVYQNWCYLSNIMCMYVLFYFTQRVRVYGKKSWNTYDMRYVPMCGTCFCFLYLKLINKNKSHAPHIRTYVDRLW